MTLCSRWLPMLRPAIQANTLAATKIESAGPVALKSSWGNLCRRQADPNRPSTAITMVAVAGP